jgi:GMC oxidoreductase
LRHCRRGRPRCTYARGGAAITPESRAEFRPSASSWSLSTGMKPINRGDIHLTGPNASDPLKIKANYLADPGDLKDLMVGIGQAREISNMTAFRPYAKREVAPGNLNKTDLERFIRNGLVTFWHQSGTAKMGHDALSVGRGRKAQSVWLGWSPGGGRLRDASRNDGEHHGALRGCWRSGRGHPAKGTTHELVRSSPYPRRERTLRCHFSGSIDLLH